jgi:hypothetical protein
VCVAGKLPRRVDRGAVVDDRDRAVVERAAYVRDSTADGLGIVVLLHLQAEAAAAGDDPALRVDLVDGQLRAVRDRLADVRARREGRVDRDQERPARGGAVRAAAGEHARGRGEDEHPTHGRHLHSVCRPR